MFFCHFVYTDPSTPRVCIVAIIANIVRLPSILFLYNDCCVRMVPVLLRVSSFPTLSVVDDASRGVATGKRSTVITAGRFDS